MNSTLKATGSLAIIPPVSTHFHDLEMQARAPPLKEMAALNSERAEIDSRIDFQVLLDAGSRIYSHV